MSIREKAAKPTPFGRQVLRERKRRQWSQRALEEKSGLDHMRIHRIETDPSREITFEEVMRLAAAFGVPASWLVRGGEVRDRVLAAARARDGEDAEDAVDQVVHVLELAEQLQRVASDLQSVRPPGGFGQSRGDVSPRDWGRLAAEGLRMRSEVVEGPIDDLPTFIESKANVFVTVDDLPESVDGLALQDPKTGFALVAAATGQPWERQRFTLAHELGHLCAGEMAIEAVSSRGQTSRHEQAAHEFARNLLVPIADLQARSQSMSHSWTAPEAAAVAWEYRVSPQVVGIQLERAGAGSTALTRQLSQTTSEAWSRLGGWAPERDSLAASAKARRVPPALAKAARLAWQDRRIPAATLGRLLGFETEETESLLREVGVTQAKKGHG